MSGQEYHEWEDDYHVLKVIHDNVYTSIIIMELRAFVVTSCTLQSYNLTLYIM